MANAFDYIVIGGGAFGAGTALALKTWKPLSRIAVLEGTHEHTASRDTDKIVRSTYPVTLFCTWAKQAHTRWGETPFKQFYHKVKWIRVFKGDSPDDWSGEHDETIKVEDMREMVGSTEDPKLDSGEVLRVNPDVAYVDCALAMDASLKYASKDDSFVRIPRNVTKLIVRDGECLGVQVNDDIYTAKEATIVAAGAWTPGLLRASDVPFRSNFFMECGVPVATMSLTPGALNSSMPVLVTEHGEIIRSERYGTLKITTKKAFKFNNFSDPDEHKERLNSLDIGPNKALLDKMLPQFRNAVLKKWICPDLMTPDQQPLIAMAEQTQRLLVAAGGSYHCAKFAPVLGDLAVRVLGKPIESGSLDDQLLRGMGWDREKGVPLHGELVPQN